MLSAIKVYGYGIYKMDSPRIGVKRPHMAIDCDLKIPSIFLV